MRGDIGTFQRLSAWLESHRRPAMDIANQDFIQLVKRTREKFGVNIDDAHDLIFADEEMRRLIARRINHDPECRKQALRDMRDKGDNSRFVEIEGKIRFRA
ncbi:MAG: hypothetical protein JNM03_09885 [Sphingopyxis sp.]|uniref:hypothetical protein n=1 Tax=Sphingopyxis sp. TaxID=1908224 RepID=UPI001A54E411|nr:hypothetical protein [Sphingopyxis sp.]MBL9070286.1 hypothetical protein [Sphingopyxis sp.]